jgi:hypothetical protein
MTCHSGLRYARRREELDMPGRRTLLILGLIAAATAAVLAQELKMPRVEVHSDPEVDYSAFKTYGWKDPGAPAERPNVHMSIIWYVERELEKKGFTKIMDDDPATPDVFIRYFAKGRSSIQGTPVQSRDFLPGGPENLTTSFDLRKAREGTLVLEMQRSSDNKAVWRAGSQFSIDEKRIDAEVSSAVDILMRKYPPK